MPAKSFSAEFVAHRGAAASCPENTLPAIQTALDCGLNWVEIDIQFSADGIPVVIHDEDLLRTAGAAGLVRKTHSPELARLSVHEQARLGRTFDPTPPPLLWDAAALLQPYPRARMFVELRVDGIRFMGRTRTMRAIHKALGDRASQCIILSYDTEILELARSEYGYPIGWVLSDYSQAFRQEAERLCADFLFAHVQDVPAGECLFKGPWQWAVYEIESTQDALDWASRGAGLIESFQACELAASLGRG
jgi:glycerophosphoryl diester phosphodiesterase